MISNSTGSFRSLALALGAALVIFGANGSVAGTVQSFRGNVRVGNQQVNEGQEIAPGRTIQTGPGAQVVLRFADGQRVVLNENTDFRIVDYRYSEADPKADRSVFDLLKGGARFVSGLLGQRSRSSFQVRAPQATIGIRGTDFMAVIVNPLYLSVSVGSIASSNAAGTVAFGAGTFGTVGTAGTLATSITAAQLPAAASSAFGSMGSAVVGATGAGATGAAGATGTGAGGVAGTVAPGVGAAAVVGGATAAAITSTSQTGTTATTHHAP